MKNEAVVTDEELPKTRRCPRCKTEKYATTEFFSIDNNRIGGLSCWCKKCQHEVKYWQKPEYKEKKRIYDAERMLNPEIREKRSIYAAKYWLNPENRERQRVRQLNPIVNEKRHIYRLNPEIRERQHIRNIERWLDPEYRENSREKQRVYLQTEKGKAVKSACIQRRRAKKIALPNVFTADELRQCLLYWENKCAYCGSSDNLTMDHFIPLASKNELCLGTVKENMVPACKHCNIAKHNKSPYVWATKEALERIEMYFASITDSADVK